MQLFRVLTGAGVEATLHQAHELRVGAGLAVESRPSEPPFWVVFEDDGDTGYLQKPFMPATLRDAIEKLMKPAPASPVDLEETGLRYARAAY